VKLSTTVEQEQSKAEFLRVITAKARQAEEDLAALKEEQRTERAAKEEDVTQCNVIIAKLRSELQAIRQSGEEETGMLEQETKDQEASNLDAYKRRHAAYTTELEETRALLLKEDAEHREGEPPVPGRQPPAASWSRVPSGWKKKEKGGGGGGWFGGGGTAVVPMLTSPRYALACAQLRRRCASGR
jgi:hypothetical protein